MPRLPVLIRQNRVFDLVVAGRTHAEICKQLRISEDTVARDMQAIGEQVQLLARERTGELLAVALANYQAVIDEAWRQYHADSRRLADWYAGRLDYEHESVVTKTLAVEGADDTGSDEGGPPPAHDESAPLEVKRTRRWVRPALQADRATWLRLVTEATRAFCELMGLTKLVVEHQQNAPVEHVHMTLDEWKAQAQSRIAGAEATLAMLDEDGDV